MVVSARPSALFTDRHHDQSFLSAVICRWHCYNTTFGDLHKVGERPQTAKDDTVVWSYDNSNSDLPFPHTHRETYEETTTVTATISKSAEVKISQSFTIEAIASSSLDITIKADSTNTTTKEEKRSHEESWNLTSVVSCMIRV